MRKGILGFAMSGGMDLRDEMVLVFWYGRGVSPGDGGWDVMHGDTEYKIYHEIIELRSRSYRSLCIGITIEYALCAHWLKTFYLLYL